MRLDVLAMQSGARVSATVAERTALADLARIVALVKAGTSIGVFEDGIMVAYFWTTPEMQAEAQAWIDAERAPWMVRANREEAAE